jgi:hypothetical protein
MSKSNSKHIAYVTRLLNREANETSLTFFSLENINKLNNGIIYQILELSKKKLNKSYKIEPQEKNKMIPIMKYIYFNFATNSDELDIEINKLNNKFLERVVPTAYNALISYLKYLETLDRSKNKLLNNPVNTQNNKDELKSISYLFNY